MIATRLLTADDLEQMGAGGEHFELIDGVPYEVTGVGGLHGGVSAYLLRHVGNHVDDHDLGEVFSSDTQFVITPDRRIVLRPDVAFVRMDRLPDDDLWRGIVPIAPDLAIEVESPGDTEPEVRRKVERYLAGGVPLVWAVWMSRRCVSVFRPGRAEQVLAEDAELDGEDVLPGFRLPVADIFRRRGRRSS
jgi:Uma2 family endonuclease